MTSESMTTPAYKTGRTAHTPGPWTFDRDWYRIPTIFGADGKIVASIEKDGREATPEREANARLIAAAPTMFDALGSGAMRDGVPIRAQRVFRQAIDALLSEGFNLLASELQAVADNQAAALSATRTTGDQS